jgi:hypothetical protein
MGGVILPGAHEHLSDGPSVLILQHLSYVDILYYYVFILFE